MCYRDDYKAQKQMDILFKRITATIMRSYFNLDCDSKSNYGTKFSHKRNSETKRNNNNNKITTNGGKRATIFSSHSKTIKSKSIAVNCKFYFIVRLQSTYASHS